MAYRHEINRVDEIDEITSNFEPSFDQSSQYEGSIDFPSPENALWQACAPVPSQTVTTCSCHWDNDSFVPFSPCPCGDIENSNVRAQRQEGLHLARLYDNSLYLYRAPTVFKRFSNLVKLLNEAKFDHLRLALQELELGVHSIANGEREDCGSIYHLLQYVEDTIKSCTINRDIFVFESQPRTYEIKRQNFSDFSFARSYVLTQLNKVTYIKTLLLPHRWNTFRFRDDISKKFPQLVGSSEFECLADDIARGCNVVFTADKAGLRVLMSRNFCAPQIKLFDGNLQIDLQMTRKKRPNSVLFVQFDGDGDIAFCNNEISAAYVVAERCTQIECQNCELETLNIDLCFNLRKLYAFSNLLKRLDVRQNALLEVLCAHQNELTEIDVSQNEQLAWLGLRQNQIALLDLRRNSQLQELFVHDNNLASIDVTPCARLRILNIENNQLTELSVENCGKLAFLLAKDNFIYALNASGCRALQEIRISGVCQSFDISISREEQTRIYFEE